MLCNQSVITLKTFRYFNIFHHDHGSFYHQTQSKKICRVTFLHYIWSTSRINPVIRNAQKPPPQSSVFYCLFHLLSQPVSMWDLQLGLTASPFFPIPGLTHILWATTKWCHWRVTRHQAQAQVTAAFLPTPTSLGTTSTVGCHERRDKEIYASNTCGDIRF